MSIASLHKQLETCTELASSCARVGRELVHKYPGNDEVRMAEMTLSRLGVVLKCAADILEPLAVRAESARAYVGSVCVLDKNTGEFFNLSDANALMCLANVMGIHESRLTPVLVTEWGEENKPTAWTQLPPRRSVLNAL